MNENTVQIREGTGARWNKIKEIGIAAKDAAKSLFLRRQDSLSEERMGAERKRVSPFATLILAGAALVAACTYNYDITNSYGQDTDTASDVDADTDSDVDSDSDSDSDTDTDTDSDTDTDTDSDTDTDADTETEEDAGVDGGDVDTETDTECVEETLEADTYRGGTNIHDFSSGDIYSEEIWVDEGHLDYYMGPLASDGYPDDAFTFEHRIGDGGLPEYVVPGGDPNTRTDRHEVSMVFNSADWEIAEFNADEESISFGQEAAGGILNIGDVLTLPNGYKLRLEDISSVENEDGEFDSIWMLLDSGDAELGMLTISPGAIVDVMGGVEGADPQLAKVNMTAPGLNFIAKWAKAVAYSGGLVTLQNGAELEGGEIVELSIGTDSFGTKVLTMIRVSRQTECDEGEPIEVKGFTNKQWTISEEGGSTCIFAAYDGLKHSSSTGSFEITGTPFGWASEITVNGSEFYEVAVEGSEASGHGTNWDSTTCAVSSGGTAFVVFVNAADSRKYLFAL